MPAIRAGLLAIRPDIHHWCRLLHLTPV